MESQKLVSIHGGHSGEFCCHATDTLEEIVAAYAGKKFHWVGITEHAPPIEDRFLYPEEIDAGFNSQTLYHRFDRYIASCRKLQRKYAGTLQIYVAFETEYYSGSIPFIGDLIRRFEPDYVVGSVHHIDDIGFDNSPGAYARAVSAAGGIEALYCRYFDAQHRMLTELRPRVVGHFDLIRLYDPDYVVHLERPAVREKVRRNLELIRHLNSIMDINARAIAKGGSEPYPTRSILKQAVELGIPLVPGDDSHGVDTVGLHIDQVIEHLADAGADTDWHRPA
jgi:histidinol-phosphatase (PHP family)